MTHRWRAYMQNTVKQRILSWASPRETLWTQFYLYLAASLSIKVAWINKFIPFSIFLFELHFITCSPKPCLHLPSLYNVEQGAHWVIFFIWMIAVAKCLSIVMKPVSLNHDWGFALLTDMVTSWSGSLKPMKYRIDRLEIALVSPLRWWLFLSLWLNIWPKQL